MEGLALNGIEHSDVSSKNDDYNPLDRVFSTERRSPSPDEKMTFDVTFQHMATQGKAKIGLKFVEKHLQRQDFEFGKWTKKELQDVFEEALGMVESEESDTRYIQNSADLAERCTHGSKCFCYLVTTEGAGIKGVSGTIRHKVLPAIHQALLEVIKVLAWFTQDDLDEEAGVLLGDILSSHELLWTGKPSSLEEEAKTRRQWLSWESRFLALGKPGRGIPAPKASILRLMGLLGRRALVIGACMKEIGALFLKKAPVCYLDIAVLVKGKGEHTRIPPADIEPPRYPTRVIDVETLRFEEDQNVFRDSYAVLSHTWGSVEVDMFTVNDVFLRMANERLQRESALIETLRNPDRMAIDGDAPGDYPGVKATKESDGKGSKYGGPRNNHRLIDRLGECRIRRKAQLPPGYAEPAADLQIDHSGLDTGNSMDPEEAAKQKLMGAIDQARALNFRYLWVDNCCIDKSHKTELNESLSSMGDWYQNSQVCLVYLDDFEGTTVPPSPYPSQRPRWSTRGWTLQEIVMSPRAVFYNKHWKYIVDTSLLKPVGTTKRTQTEDVAFPIEIPGNTDDGDKAKDGDTSLGDDGYLLPDDVAFRLDDTWFANDCEILRLQILEDLAYLCNVRSSSLICCGKRPEVAASFLLQIASDRETSRTEDRAYSLMGLLGVRMTTNYGEGRKMAISRLLESIIRTTGDVSIFNWNGIQNGAIGPGSSMFPADFHAFKGTINTKPVKSKSAITVSRVRVHARFDICDIEEFVVENGNSEALRKIEAYGELYSVSPEASSTRCLCAFSIRAPIRVSMKVFCPLKSLFHLPRDHEKPAPAPARTKWVLARRGGVEESDWFVCELYASNSHRPDYEGGGAFPPGGARANTAGSPVHSTRTHLLRYLEASGFRGKRLPSTPGRFKPTKIRSVVMWVE